MAAIIRQREGVVIEGSACNGESVTQGISLGFCGGATQRRRRALAIPWVYQSVGASDNGFCWERLESSIGTLRYRAFEGLLYGIRPSGLNHLSGGISASGPSQSSRGIRSVLW